MTDIDAQPGITVGGEPVEIWRPGAPWHPGMWSPPIPGYSSCIAGDRGDIASIDRTLPDGRRRTGQVLKSRASNRPTGPGAKYRLMNVTDDDGQRQTCTVHWLQMLAFEGPAAAGEQTRHYNDVPDDNRWAPGGEANCGPGKPGNLVRGTQPQNEADKARNAEMARLLEMGRLVRAPRPQSRLRRWLQRWLP